MRLFPSNVSSSLYLMVFVQAYINMAHTKRPKKRPDSDNESTAIIYSIVNIVVIHKRIAFTIVFIAFMY